MTASLVETVARMLRPHDFDNGHTDDCDLCRENREGHRANARKIIAAVLADMERPSHAMCAVAWDRAPQDMRDMLDHHFGMAWQDMLAQYRKEKLP
jgi:hypothetical protein